MRTVIITKTQTFKRTASIEVQVPLNIKDSEVGDYLFAKDDWEEELDNNLERHDLILEPEFDDVRYDVYETKRIQTYGGHI